MSDVQSDDDVDDCDDDERRRHRRSSFDAQLCVGLTFAMTLLDRSSEHRYSNLRHVRVRIQQITTICRHARAPAKYTDSNLTDFGTRGARQMAKENIQRKRSLRESASGDRRRGWNREWRVTACVNDSYQPAPYQPSSYQSAPYQPAPCQAYPCQAATCCAP